MPRWSTAPRPSAIPIPSFIRRSSNLQPPRFLWDNFIRRVSRPRSSSTPIVTSHPVISSAQFIFLCTLWYATSALSSNTGKVIMTHFRYPITLTFIQFGFVAIYCLIFMSPIIRFTRLRTPTIAIVRNTLPMGMFQVGGHICSSMAIARIPVSTVHTIKALSPLFTVAAYAVLFGVSYSPKTYLSLFPLTFGVMLACSFDVSASNFIGLCCAFGSAIVFVSSNIFYKRIMPSNMNSHMHSHKLDKLNLLFYSSSMAFLLMIPIWIFGDLRALLIHQPSHGSSNSSAITYHFFMNGTVHFAQNIIAFVILSSTSPVTYSIASLVKRVVVICVAILWFKQSLHLLQGFGIALTFMGLYMYNGAKGEIETGEKKLRRIEAARQIVLPTTENDVRSMAGAVSPPPEDLQIRTTRSSTAEYDRTTGKSSAAHVPQLPVHDIEWSLQRPHSRIQPPSQLAGVPMKITLPHKDPVLTPNSYPSPPPSRDSVPSSPTFLLQSGAKSGMYLPDTFVLPSFNLIQT